MIKDEASYIQRAMHSYQNVQCISLDEFNEDLNRITSIKKAITRFKNGEEVNIRLLLNQFVILFNVFDDTAFDMLKYKLDPGHYPIAFAFLVVLNRLPDSEAIMLDQNIVAKLKEEIK